MVAKLAGLVAKRSSHSCSRSINNRPVWSATTAGGGTWGPLDRRDLPLGLLAHLFFRLVPDFHRWLLPGGPPRCLAILADGDLFVAAFWDQTRPDWRSGATAWSGSL